MISFEEAGQKGAAHRKKIDDAIASMNTVKPHPLIGFIDGFLGRAVGSISTARPSRATTRLLSGTSSGTRATLPRLVIPSLKMPGSKPLKVAVGSLLVGTVAYASVYGTTLMAPSGTEGLFTSAAQSLVPENIAAPIDAGFKCAVRMPLVDENHDLLGYYRPYEDFCEIQEPSHRSAPLSDDAVSRLSDVYALREGEYFGRGSVLGFHLAAPYQIIRAKVTHGVTIGASTPLETAQKNALGQGGGLSWTAKLGSIARLPATAAHIAPTEEQRDRLVAENMPCLTGGSGSGLGGVLSGDFCGIIFGRQSLGMPSWAEACVVVSAANVPVRVLGQSRNSLSAIEHQAKRWSETVSLAKGCVAELLSEGFLASNQAYSDALMEIDQMAPPQPRPSGYYNPDLALARNVPGLKLSSLEIGADENSPIVLTLDAAAHRQAEQSVSNQLPQYLQRGSSSLCFSGDCADALQADVAIFVGEIIDGQLLTRVKFETRHGLLEGPDETAPHRSIGSLGKAIVAPLIAMAGITTECLRPIYGLHDPIPRGFPGSDDCGQNTKSLSEIYATSSNIGIANALKHVGDRLLREYLELVGAAFDPTASEVQIKRGITVGDAVVMSPMNFVETFAAQMSAGEIRRSIIQASDSGDLLSLRTIVDQPMAYQVSRSWLSSPLQSGGTASNLGERLAVEDCKFSAAKTGTSDSIVPAQWRDKLIGFYTVCNGRPFVVIAMLGSPDAQLPLGQIYTNDLTALMWSTFESAIN
ncbi:hypothetical protein [Yoonia sp. 208BN28-4]|uniref:hypothetical protein n=1 Tax=Yoonia sp. 208BN28-4 TaxID=3126505 RepID=UPI0030A91DD3